MARTSADKERVVPVAALMNLPRRKLLVRVTVLETLDPVPGDPRVTLQLTDLKQVRVVTA